MALLLASAFSSTYVLPVPAMAPTRATVVMNGALMNSDATRDPEPIVAAPKSGWTLTMAGGVLTLSLIHI